MIMSLNRLPKGNLTYIIFNACLYLSSEIAENQIFVLALICCCYEINRQASEGVKTTSWITQAATSVRLIISGLKLYVGQMRIENRKNHVASM
jgi:hypothetical protein